MLLAINCYYQGADLFLIATVNPKWPKIQEALLSGQSASDCPDIIYNVFHLKMAQFIKDIVSMALWDAQWHESGLMNFRKEDFHIWDEALMQHHHNHEAVIILFIIFAILRSHLVALLLSLVVTSSKSSQSLSRGQELRLLVLLFSSQF